MNFKPDKLLASRRTRKQINLFSSTSSQQQSQQTKLNGKTTAKKKRMNNDSFEESPIKLPLRKPFRASDGESRNKEINIPITWDTKNKEVDCKLKVACDLEVTQPSDNDQSYQRNEIKMDQMLSEFYNKLQFNALTASVAAVEKDSDKDSGNEDKGNEIDELLDNTPAIEDNDNELNQLNRQTTKHTSDQSKESGVISYCSTTDDSNKPSSVSPCSQEKLKSNDFKIPETPAKGLIKSNNQPNTARQFNSTPKLISRQLSRLNQSLHFEDISPIKGNDNCLVNVNQEGKRPFNDSMNEESTSNKKRNGKILFPIQTSTAKQMQKHDDFDDLIDDSFDMVLSQLDDKAISNGILLTKNNKQPPFKNNPPPIKQVKIEQNCKSDPEELFDDSLDVLLSQIDDKFLTNGMQLNINSTNQKLPIRNNNQLPQRANQRIQQQFKPKIDYSRPIQQPIRSLSNNNLLTPVSRTSLSSTQSTTSSRSTQVSSIQFEDDSSSLFIRNSSKSKFIAKSQLANLHMNHVQVPGMSNNNRVNIETKSQADIDMFDDDDADFICSQVVL